MGRNENLVELGKRIRYLRKLKNLSQEQFAFLANVDRSYMGGIERGERNIGFLMLVRIAHILECDIAAITKDIP